MPPGGFRYSRTTKAERGALISPRTATASEEQANVHDVAETVAEARRLVPSDVSAYSRPRCRSTSGVSCGIQIGPTLVRTVASSRKLSGSLSKPATWPNAYRSVCRLPQLWFWLPVQPSTGIVRPATVSEPVNRASGSETRLFALGKPPE